MPRNTTSVSPVAEPSASVNVVKSNSGNSLSLSLDSGSERKRRIAMPNRSSPRSSASDTNVPATKLGRSISGNSITNPNVMQSHSSSARGDSAYGFVVAENEPSACGRIRPLNTRRHHECTAIIRDAFNGTKAITCRVKCPLGDMLTHRYPPVPHCNKAMVTTGRNCLDMSTKELATHGIKCIEHLYKGLFSNIFVGYMEATHQYVAVKITNIGNHCCKRELRTISPCFEAGHNSQEIKYLVQFKHPNIINILAQFDTKSTKKAIVLQFHPNGRLSRILEKTKLMSEAVASRFFHQMFEAVKYIHSQGYAVRNIALKHFLLSDSKQIKMIDLSEVCPLGEVHSSHTVGVAGFQAPEMLKPYTHMAFAEKADMWSLGACLYSMLTGVLTSTSHSCALSYKDAFVYREPMKQLLSSSIFELLAGMLEYLPQHRFSSTRIEYSEWYNQSFDAPITGCYLLRQAQKVKLGKQEMPGRDNMEL